MNGINMEPQASTRTERRATNQLQEVRFIRIKEVLAICAMSRSSVYEGIRKGEFPKPIKLCGRSAAWIKSEIEEWAKARIAASRQQKESNSAPLTAKKIL
jgi:prophage regulatory protein